MKMSTAASREPSSVSQLSHLDSFVVFSARHSVFCLFHDSFVFFALRRVEHSHSHPHMHLHEHAHLLGQENEHEHHQLDPFLTPRHSLLPHSHPHASARPRLVSSTESVIRLLCSLLSGVALGFAIGQIVLSLVNFIAITQSSFLSLTTLFSLRALMSMVATLLLGRFFFSYRLHASPSLFLFLSLAASALFTFTIPFSPSVGMLIFLSSCQAFFLTCVEALCNALFIDTYASDSPRKVRCFLWCFFSFIHVSLSFPPCLSQSARSLQLLRFLFLVAAAGVALAVSPYLSPSASAPSSSSYFNWTFVIVALTFVPSCLLCIPLIASHTWSFSSRSRARALRPDHSVISSALSSEAWLSPFTQLSLLGSISVFATPPFADAHSHAGKFHRHAVRILSLTIHFPLSFISFHFAWLCSVLPVFD